MERVRAGFEVALAGEEAGEGGGSVSVGRREVVSVRMRGRRAAVRWCIWGWF